MLDAMRPALLLLILGSYVYAQQSDPTQLLNTALQEQQRGDYPSAIRDYRHVLELRPDIVVAKVNLGAALSDTGKYEEAIALFQEALSSVPDKNPVRMNLALAYFRKGDLAPAHEQLAAVHQEDPRDQKATWLLANIDLRMGNAAEALTLLEPLDAANANNMEFQYSYGTALISAGREKEGVLRVQRVAEATSHANAYMLAGSTLLRMNQPAFARQDLERALQLDPKLPGILTLVGIAQDKTGDAAAAEPTLREALQVNPDDFDANLTLGAILYKRRALEEARRYLQRALKLRPKDQTARYEWAMLNIANGEYATAVDFLAQLSHDYPDWLEPHIALSTAYYKLHRVEDGERERKIVERLTEQQSTQKNSN
jgi:Flp pilus assembly protein TadD